MEMEAFTGKLHAYLRSVSTRVRALSVSLFSHSIRHLPTTNGTTDGTTRSPDPRGGG